MQGGSQSSATLYGLPDDILRRIIDTVGRDTLDTGAHHALPDPHAPSPLRTAHVLAAVSSRLRSYVINSYLPSVARLSHRDFAPLAAHENVTVAAEALVALLHRTTNLKVFASEGTKPGLITSPAIAAMTSSAAKTLEDVDIKYIDVTDEAVRPLFGCPNLKKLHMSYGRDLTPAVFNFGAEGAITAPFVDLDLTWLSCVDKNAVRHIAQIRTLETLLLKNCEHFNDEAATILAAGSAARSLKKLGLSYCPIANETLMSLIRALPKLSELLLAERPGSHAIEGAYTQAGIDEARSTFPQINVIVDT